MRPHSAGRVHVAHNPHVAASEVPEAVLGHVVAADGGAKHSERGAPVAVLLAFGKDEGHVRVSDYLGQLIRDTTTAVEVPNPAALTVGLALAEVLRLEAHILIERCAFLIRVVIGLGDTAILRRLRLDRLHRVRERVADLGSALADARMAVAFAIWFEGRKPELLADVVLGFDRIVRGR